MTRCRDNAKGQPRKDRKSKTTVIREKGKWAMENANESLERLIEYEKKYCNSSKLANTQMMYWSYKILGHISLREAIPEIDDWVRHYEHFLDCGGDPYQLKQKGTFLGQYF